MTTRPLTARLTTAALAVIVGTGLPALAVLMMVRAPAADALPTAALERVEVVAKRLDRPAQTSPIAPPSQTVWTGPTTRTPPTGQSARAEAPSAAARGVAM
jgi:hypothetical protein